MDDAYAWASLVKIAQASMISILADFGRGHMHEHSDYLREQATKYRELAAKANDTVAKQEFCELAKVCEEVANDMDDRRVSG